MDGELESLPVEAKDSGEVSKVGADAGTGLDGRLRLVGMSLASPLWVLLVLLALSLVWVASS